MPDQSWSVGDAQPRAIEVLRDQNPEWVDAAGECLPCVPHELELAAHGLMQRRVASINDVLITETDRKFGWERTS
jgi:nuclear transport factor 2 (NTF2) superfamily protein